MKNNTEKKLQDIKPATQQHNSVIISIKKKKEKKKKGWIICRKTWEAYGFVWFSQC